MTGPPDPEAVKVILAAERARLDSIIDKRIRAWEEFQAEFPDHPGLDVLLAELDHIRSRINDNKPIRPTNIRIQD